MTGSDFRFTSQKLATLNGAATRPCVTQLPPFRMGGCVESAPPGVAYAAVLSRVVQDRTPSGLRDFDDLAYCSRQQQAHQPQHFGPIQQHPLPNSGQREFGSQV